MKSSHIIREQVGKLYEEMCLDQILAVTRSLNAKYKRSCGCFISHMKYSSWDKWICEHSAFQNRSIICDNRVEYGNFRRYIIPKTKGLVCRLLFGGTSEITLNFSNENKLAWRGGCNLSPVNKDYVPAFHDGIFYKPIEGQIMTVNGIPIKFLFTENCNGPNYNGYYNTRVYFEVDCTEFDKRMKAYHFIKRLRRNEKSLFSRLPKELIKHIQSYLLTK